MIRLDIRSRATCELILKIQRPAYTIESELIAFRIPMIDESVEDLMVTNELFYGIYEEEKLLGFIALEPSGSKIQISRLCVHPNYFGRGIGQSLVRGVLNEFLDKTFFVTTGALNKPAIGLYESCGFEVVESFYIEEVLEMVKMFLIN